MTDLDSLLVLGASADLGLALLRGILESEPRTRIIAHAFNRAPRLEALADELGVRDRMSVVRADLSSPTGAGDLVSVLEASGALPHRVVHLPALPLVYERFGKARLDRFELDLRIQVTSLATVLQRLLPEMARRCASDSRAPNGKVVIVSSSVLVGTPPKNTTMYTAVKYAQAGLARALTAEFAEHRINVNLVAPSMIETGFLDQIPRKAIELAAAQNPMRRNARPGDVIPVVRFFLSAESDYITGTNIPVAGGLTF